jgi:hypothetical protein
MIATAAAQEAQLWLLAPGAKGGKSTLDFNKWFEIEIT